MPIEDPEGEFGSFKRSLFEIIRQKDLVHQILLKTDAYKEFGPCPSAFTSGAFWHFVCEKTIFKPEQIDLGFWEQFPILKKEIEGNSEIIDGFLVYKYKYPRVTSIQDYTSEVI